tara:strand:- start:1829 stop:2302 length:474 start_codon:yes stop_codon:yes gene_type:complete
MNKYLTRAIIFFLFLIAACIILTGCKSVQKTKEASSIELDSVKELDIISNTNAVIKSNTTDLNTLITAADTSKPITVETIGNKTIYTNAKDLSITASNKEEETQIEKEETEKGSEAIKIEAETKTKDVDKKVIPTGVIIGFFVVTFVLFILWRKRVI